MKRKDCFKRYKRKVVFLLLLLCATMFLYGCNSNKELNKGNESETCLSEKTSKEEIVAEETGIQLNVENAKRNYNINEKLDLSGLSVMVVYNTGEEKLLSVQDYKINDVDMTSYGTKEVVITYKEYSQSFAIEVSYVVTDVEPITKYASTSLNLRNGAGVEFDKMESVPLNTELTVIGEVDNGWVKVLYNNNEYFCSGKYLMGEKKEIPLTQPQVEKQEQIEIKEPVATSGLYDNVVIGETGSSASVVNHANAYWNSRVPAWLKQKFVESGWKFVISGSPLNQRYGYAGRIAGMTDYSKKTIFLDNRKTCVDSSVLHELGHFTDFVNKFPSKNSEFSQIFEAEKSFFADSSGVGDGHHISSTIEYFASVFHEIMINGTDCQTRTPRSYEFVSRYMH